MHGSMVPSDGSVRARRIEGKSANFPLRLWDVGVKGESGEDEREGTITPKLQVISESVSLVRIPPLVLGMGRK